MSVSVQPAAGTDPPVDLGSDSPRLESGPPDEVTPVRMGRGLRLLRALGLLLVAVAGGLLVAVSFPPNDALRPLAVLGPALLALAVRNRRVWPSLGLGFAFGMGFFVPHVSWSGEYLGALPWMALSIYQSLFLMLLGPALALVQRLPAWPVWAAALWVADEALRARVFFGGFPWGRIGFSQDAGAFTPYAAIGGAPLLSFAVALCGFLLAATAVAAATTRMHADWRALGRVIGIPLAAAVAVPLVGSALWAVVPDGSGAPTATIAVVQGDVPQAGMEFNARRRAVLDNHVAQTMQLAERIQQGKTPQPELVVWPENSSDIDPLRNPDAGAEIQEAANAVGAPILVGAVLLGPGEHTRNAGLLWWPDTGPGQTYVKRHPVPFAEYMPYRDFFRTFTSMVDMAGNFVAGSEPGNMDVTRPDGSVLRIGDVICFEVAYDDLVADVVDGGAQVLVIQTNNATFGWTGESYQQLAMGRIRAVEHGRSLLSVSTSGVTAVVSPDGELLDASGLYEPAVFVRSVPLLDTTTVADEVDEILEWTLTVLGLAALVAALVLPRRARARAAATERANAE